MADPLYSFGSWLRLRRQSLVLTREQLAQKVGCAEVTIRKIEADERKPSPQVAGLLARHLAVPAEQRDLVVRAARGMLPVDQMPPAQSVTFVAVQVQNAASTPTQIIDNLPAALRPLLGREQELSAIGEYLLQQRLVTLTGAGGTGKTSLALQVARGLRKGYRHGIWFVDLSPVSDGEQVAGVIAKVLGVPESSDRPMRESLGYWMHERQLLLLLDNCEQVLTAVAELAGDLLRQAAQLQVLATSRMPLRISAEQEYPVAPLALPDMRTSPDVEAISHYAAIALFVARTQAVRPEFALDEANAATIASICARLEGLPLAIELAAARMRLFTAEQLLSRLSVDRMQTLVGGARDMPARQQTMAATVAWSYDLLSSEQQRLVMRLGVFVGGWTLEAAETVCGHDLDVVSVLEALLEQSLVQRIASEVGPRYRMLETIREYALEQLGQHGELDELHQRHAEYVVALVEQAEPKLRSRDQMAWLMRLDQDYDNIHASLEWALVEGHNQALGLRLAATLWFAWLLMGRYADARRWQGGVWAYDQSLSLQHRARLLVGRELINEWATGGLRFVLDYMNDEGMALIRQANDPQLLCFALANLAVHKHDFIGHTVLDYAKESLRLATDLQDSWLETYARIGLGVSQCFCDGNSALALTTLKDAAKQAQELGEHWLLGMLHWSEGMVLLRMNAYQQALQAFYNQIDNNVALGNRINGAFALWGVAHTAQQLGNYNVARIYQQARLEAEKAALNIKGIADSMIAVANMAAMQSDYQAAKSQLEQCLAFSEEQKRFDNVVQSYCILAWIALEQGDVETSDHLFHQAWAGIQENFPNGDIPFWALNDYAAYDICRGHLAQSQEKLDLAIQNAPDDDRYKVQALLCRGVFLYHTGSFHEAQAILAHCCQQYGDFGDRWVIRESIPQLGYTCLALGQFQEASHYFAEALRFFVHGALLWRIAWVLDGVAMLAAEMLLLDTAPRLWGATEALREQIGAVMFPVDRPEYERRVALAHAQCNPDAWELAWAAGRALSWEQAADEALHWLENVR